MHLHEVQPGLQTFLKTVGCAERDADRLQDPRVEWITREVLLVQLYRAVNFAEHECDVAEGARQEIESGVDFAHALRVRLRSRPIPLNASLETGPRVICPGEFRVEPDGVVQRIENSPALVPRWRSLQDFLAEVRAREACPCQRIVGLDVDRLLVELGSFFDIAQGPACLEVISLQNEVVRADIGLPVHCPMAIPQRDAQGLSNLLCNLVLYLENVDEVAVVGLGPQMRSV